MVLPELVLPVTQTMPRATALPEALTVSKAKPKPLEVISGDLLVEEPEKNELISALVTALVY